MTKLKTLDVQQTEIADFSPLEGLAELRRINATGSNVSRLPTRIPNLRQLSAIGPRLTDEAIHTFQDRNPNCLMKCRWTASLRAELITATRLRVRSGGTYMRDEALEKTLFESKNADEINQFVTGIQIDEKCEGRAACMCCGSPSLEFYEGDRLIVTLGIHHGYSLRWPNGPWPGDAPLTQQSGEFLAEWLANRDVMEPWEYRQEMKRKRLSYEKENERSTSGMSPSLANAFRSTLKNSDDDEFISVLVAEIPEKPSRIEVLLRVFGAANEGWLSLGGTVRTADKQLDTSEVTILSHAVEKALQGNDRQLRRGAVRYWKSHKTRQAPLAEWKPKNLAQLHQIVVQIEQEARYDQLRVDALYDLAEWKADFSQEELDRRLTAGFYDPSSRVRRGPMRVAGKLKHRASIELLQRIQKGEILPPRPLPEVPLSESEYVSKEESEAQLITYGYPAEAEDAELTLHEILDADHDSK